MHRTGVSRIDPVGSLALLGCVLFWSLIPVLLRNLTADIDAWTANGFRYPLAASLYWPILWRAKRQGRLPEGTWKRCLLPAVLTGFGQTFWALSPYYLPASAIGFFVRTSLVWALLAAVIIFPDERRLLQRPLFYVGMGLCVVGFLGWTLAQPSWDGQVTLQGVVIISLCSLFFGLYSVSVRYCLGDVPPLIGFGIVCQYVAAATFTSMLFLGDPGRLRSLDAAAWAQLCGSSLLGIAIGHFCLYTAVQRVGAAISSGVQNVAPFLTAIWAGWILNEALDGFEWAAGVTLVVGALLLMLTQDSINRASRALPSTAAGDG